MKRILVLFLSTTFMTCTLLHAETTWLSNSSKVQLKDAPPAVRNAIQAQAAGAKIEDVEKGTLNGRMVYEAAFKRNGQHTELRVAEDGTIVDTIVAGVSQGAAGKVVATTPAAPQAYEAGFEKKLSGSHKVKWENVPANVKNIVSQRSGGAKIEDAERGTAAGKTMYEIAYKKNGQHTELRVSEDGKFVHEVVAGKTAHWTLPASGFDTSLADAKNLQFQQLPANLQKTIKDRIGNAQIESVAQGTVNGTPAYQVSYMQNNKRGELRVTQDGKGMRQTLGGQVIYEGAGAAKLK